MILTFEDLPKFRGSVSMVDGAFDPLHAGHVEYFRAAAELGRPLALIADLQGPKFRLENLAQPRMLTTGTTVHVASEQAAHDGDLVVAPAAIADALRPGHDVLIDDGLIRLAVEEVSGGRARCFVVVGGEVSSHKGVNLPGLAVPVPSLSAKDRHDLDFALGLGVDYVALSFVRTAGDVRELKDRQGTRLVDALAAAIAG